MMKFLLFLVVSGMSVTTNELANSSSNECPVPKETVPSTVKLKQGVTPLEDIRNIIFLDAASKNSGIIEEGLSDFSPTPSVINFDPAPTSNQIELHVEEILKNKSSEENESLDRGYSGDGNLPAPEIDAGAADAVNVTIESSPSAPNATAGTNDGGNSTEDSPIPLFSEWAQQQMQEAEQKQREDEANGSISATSRTSKPNGQKVPIMKLRAKNYASPDCGAKILAANSEASSASSVLTASKDEYLLNPCSARVWFVVELCEPIQAEKIDLANFELFSSSPKEFTVSVSNRFPTREWQNVGKFSANDERTIQNFTLSPQVFGKFVRVEIHSHYNSEHFCPVSLFRVFGTSEFEAFETDNQPFKIVESYDDDDDEEAEEVTTEKTDESKKTDDKNILKVVGEAVGNMVKKAAEVLSNKQLNETKGASEVLCQSVTNDFECITCSERLRAEVVYALQCHRIALNRFRAIPVVSRKLMESRLCANYVNFPYTTKDQIPYNYVTVMLRLNMAIALCNELKAVYVPVTEIPIVTEYLPEYKELLTEPTESTEFVTTTEPTPTEVEPVEIEDEDTAEVTVKVPPLVAPPLETDRVEEEEVPVLEKPPEEVKSEEKKEEVVDTWESLEQELNNGTDNGGVETSTPSNTNGNNGQKTQQSESVFMRLSNRIKALERNMSLSGQYLEELSRRYKKQVEELQQSFTKTLSQIEEQNRRYMEREQHLFEQNIRLRHDLNELMDSLHNWKTIILYVGGFVCVQVLLLFALVRHCSRRNAMLAEALEESFTRKRKKNLVKRRKSIDVLQRSPGGGGGIRRQRRRPSEEALNITGHYEDLLIDEKDEPIEIKTKKKRKDKTKNKLVKRGSSSGESTTESKRKELTRSDAVTDTGSRIEEMPYLEDNDEFIIPTASEFSYNEYVPSEKMNGGEPSISETSSKSFSSRFSSPNIFASKRARKTSTPETNSGWDWLRRSSKAKSESSENGHVSLGAFSDQSSLSSSTTSNKKKTGSFKKILKSVLSQK